MQASSLPNTPSILTPIYSRQLDNNNFLNIPSIVTSPSIPTSVSESFLFNYQQEQLNSPISQAISAPVTPTSSVTPGFSHPPRRGKGNQNGSSSSNDVKSNGSKSNSNLAHIPCKFFKSGACTAGKNCVFSHSKDPPSDNYVCKYFLKGNCKFGSKCALSHTLPNERKSTSSNGRNGTKNANGSRNSISNNIIPEIRSPTMLPQDLNDFHPLSSPGIPPFTRIPISPSSEYANNRQFSQLTASLNDPSAFSDENHTAPRLRNINTNFNNDHLSAPININGQQRRSLPDIFHLGGPMNNNNNHHNHNHNYNHNHNNNNNNAAESFGTSPFHNPGSKSIFLPLSYVSDSGMLSPTTNSHQHLHSIPELHDYSHHEDTILDDFTAYEYEEFLPSSLTDLLTPTERQRRQSRQEEIAEISPRKLFSGSSMLHPMHVDGQHLNYYNSHVDPTHIHFAGRSLPHGIGVGLAANYMNHNEGQVNNAYGAFGFPSGASMRNNTGYGEDWNDQLSPLSPLHPIHNQNHHHFNNNNNPGYSSDNHGPYSGTPAINIPLPHEVHQTDTNSPLYPSFGIIGRPNVNTNGNGNKNGRSTTPPDPFSPFGPDDDVFVFFNMEEDKNDQVSTEVPTSKSSEQPKTPLSYSAITKTGLKDSGATPGLSIDSRRYEPLCPFGIAGNCRYGEHCHYLHGMPCPSCLKHVLHPYQSSEEHQDHINECINKQVQVADGVMPEDLECEICHEKVLSKVDARFGLLNCEHAFCLQCIRQWRTTDNQACPICKTPSHFITPSTTWITDRAEKQRVINEYKRKCGAIPCRNFNYGEGQCQFGTSCFYAHTYRDGTKEEINTRTIQNGEEVKILDNVRLWDFMEDFANKHTASAENSTDGPGVVGNNDNKELLNRADNSSQNDDNDTDDSADTPTITITTFMSNLSVNSSVFIPSNNGAADSAKDEEKN